MWLRAVHDQEPSRPWSKPRIRDRAREITVSSSTAAALACLDALGGCGDDEPEIKTGQWGGLGTELNVTTSGAKEGSVARAVAVLAFLLVAFLALHLAIRERPTAHADSAEYILAAESLFNHGTPNVYPANLLSRALLQVRAGSSQPSS